MALLTLKFVTDVKDLDYEVIEFHGELDQSNLANTEKQINDVLQNFNRPCLIFDFADLKFINSEGIGFVVGIHTKLVKKGQKLLLASVRGNVAEIFEVIGMPKLIPIFKTITEAIQSIKRN